MLHVTDALLSLGTLQVASRSVRTRKTAGSSRPEGLDSKGYGEPEEEVENKQRGCKSQWKRRRIFPLDFSLETLRFESRESNSSKRVEISKRFVKKLEREEKCQVVKQRLSLKSISREHRENRTIVQTSYYMLQYATTHGSTITWNRMVTRRIAILLLKMTDNSVGGKAELLPIISRE